VMLVVAPLMHGNAQWVMWNAFMMAGTAVLYTGHRYDPDALWRLVGEEGVQSVGLVGDAMARPLADALARAPSGTYDTSSLVVVGSGGAMLSKTVKEELQQRLPGVMVLDSFGSSESGAQGSVQDGTAGPRFVMKDDTSVLDENLLPLTPGDSRIGRLARTGRIPIGYYKDRAKTEATFPVDASGVRWSIPGDLASVEGDGTIVVHGRGSGSINSGGEKVFPEEVEAAVKTHPGVFDAIVVGIPDERFGERVAVAVRPRDPGAAPSLEELQDHCRAHLAAYKIPRQLLVVEAVPLTASGKPDAKAAKALF
jgi:3-oxocholest-4-en-26-oate---CoA ligase